MWQDAKDRAKEQLGKMSLKKKKNRGGEGAEEAAVQWLRDKNKGQKYS